MKTFGNIIWHFPFLGFILSFIYAICGLLWCITIIGIPLGLGLFQLSLFTLAPFSQRLVSRQDLEMLTGEKQGSLVKAWFLIIRILYLPFGLLAAIGSIIHIIAQFISIIGIPCGIVESKALSTIFNPVNKKCVPIAVAEEIERRKANNTLNKYYKSPQNITTTAVNAEENELKENGNGVGTANDYKPKPTVHPETPVQSERPIQQVIPIQAHSTQPSLNVSPAPSETAPLSGKSYNVKAIGIAAAVLVLICLVTGYFMWYIPYAKDRDALRTYVVANNVFLRSSQMAGVEYNIIQKVPYGSELITYSKDKDWAEVKVNGVTGYVASPYLLNWSDFSLLNGVWGSTDTKEYIESSKCRLALVDYCKRNQLHTGNNAWQLHTLQKDVKPNNVLFPRLKNGYDKFTEFAFILKNNLTQERRFALYSFEEETEKPVFIHEEYAPGDALIKNIKLWKNGYQITYIATH